MEQRYQAVLAVIQDGWKGTEVATRLGVSRQSVHTWIARYERGGLAALAEHSHRPNGCPHQIAPEVEAAIYELRREHPGWGPRRIEHRLARRGVDPVPARSSIYRCLRRHGLIELRRRRKRRDEFRRWERGAGWGDWCCAPPTPLRSCLIRGGAARHAPAPAQRGAEAPDHRGGARGAAGLRSARRQRRKPPRRSTPDRLAPRGGCRRVQTQPNGRISVLSITRLCREDNPPSSVLIGARRMCTGHARRSLPAVSQ